MQVCIRGRDWLNEQGDREMALSDTQLVRWIGMSLILWMISIPWADARENDGLNNPNPLVVHFAKNRTDLSKTETSKLRQTLEAISLSDQERVFVVGYADSSGDPTHNRKLALKRAQTVRTLLIREFKLDSKKVIAIGQGTQDPVADNRKKAGRAKNRRAEIYVVVGSQQTLPSKVVLPEPDMPAISKVLDKARGHIRHDQWEAALVQLDKARSLGAGQVSDWHALNGILGFLTGAPMSQVQTYLETALKLDPHNGDAREFLSRVEARDNVAEGRVKVDMGRSAQSAIAVSTMAQQYEYLTLFGAAPRYHHRLDYLPVDVWECLSLQGEPVVYYFDHSNINSWAFGSQPGVSVKTINEQRRVSPPIQQTTPPLSSNSHMSAVQVSSGPISTPRTIWESKLFH